MIEKIKHHRFRFLWLSLAIGLLIISIIMWLVPGEYEYISKPEKAFFKKIEAIDLGKELTDASAENLLHEAEFLFDQRLTAQGDLATKIYEKSRIDQEPLDESVVTETVNDFIPESPASAVVRYVVKPSPGNKKQLETIFLKEGYSIAFIDEMIARGDRIHPTNLVTELAYRTEDLFGDSSTAFKYSAPWNWDFLNPIRDWFGGIFTTVKYLVYSLLIIAFLIAMYKLGAFEMLLEMLQKYRNKDPAK